MFSRWADRDDVGRRSLLPWAFVGLLILFQWLLFVQFARREIIPFPPRHNDQTAYLSHSYQTYETILAHGLRQGVRLGLKAPLANGMLLHVQAAVLYLFFGAERLTALGLNFLYFAAFQGALVATVFWLTRRWSVAFFALGLLLVAQSPHAWIGGLADFRIDSIAFSLFGIFLCVVVRSGFFASRRWSLAAGAVAAVLVLFRFIVAVYLAGILGLALLYYGGRWWARRRPPEARRLGGLCLAGLVTAAIAVPPMVKKARLLWSYYVVNHVLGGEKNVRAEEFGASGGARAVFYYAHSLAVDHLGKVFLVLAAAGIVNALILRRGSCRKPSGTRLPLGLRQLPASHLAWFFLTVCLAVPCAILTVNVSKSPVVGSILVPVVLWLALWPLLAAASRLEGSRVVLGGLAAVALFGGALNQIRAATQRNLWPGADEEAPRLAALYDDIVHYCVANRLRQPLYLTNVITDITASSTIHVFAYERHGALVNLGERIGGTIMDVEEATALQTLAQSDVVLLGDAPCQACPYYPFHKRMEALLTRMREVCERDMIPLRQDFVQRQYLTLYVRPRLAVVGGMGGWVTDRGITLTGPATALRKMPAVQLQGHFRPHMLGYRLPRGTVSFSTRSGPKELPVALEAEGEKYTIRFTVDPADFEGDGQAILRLHFDSYFIPSDLGLNDDRRRLVVYVPECSLGYAP